MKDELSRENAIRLFDLFFPKLGLLRDEERQCDWMAKEVHAGIKSLLTPVPTDVRDKFVWHWIFKEIDFDYDDLIDFLKAYDNLREGKEG